jgi:putative ABC transport system permease protein
LYSVLLGAFAGFALLVSGIGIFGVLSYSVAQRTREIGVRSALGATSREITGLIMRQGLRVAVWGIAIGLATAFLLARQVGSLLYGVSARDPWTFAAVPVVLVAVTVLACYVPARRAARVDPLSVLKGQ